MLDAAMDAAMEAARALVVLDGGLRPCVVLSGGTERLILVELGDGDERELARVLHRELPRLLLEVGARAVVLVGGDRALALAHDPEAEVDPASASASVWCVGAAADGGSALAVAPLMNATSPVVGAFTVFDDGELLMPVVPWLLWRGLAHATSATARSRSRHQGTAF